MTRMIIDLTVPIETGHFRWPVERRTISSHAAGDLVEVTWVGWPVHGFTHMDSPRHIDPDGCTFWGTAEYVNGGGSWQWDTYIGAFTMPGCTPSGFGTLDGMVYNAITMDPIGGALIEANGFTAFTQPDGTYAMNLAVDTYDVTASAFGFAPNTVMGVEIFALKMSDVLQICNDHIAKRLGLLIGVVNERRQHVVVEHRPPVADLGRLIRER